MISGSDDEMVMRKGEGEKHYDLLLPQPEDVYYFIYPQEGIYDGIKQPHPPRMLNIIQDLLEHLFRGWSCHDGLDGAWISKAGKRYYNPNQMIFEIRLDSGRIPQLLDLLRKIAKASGQEAIYVKHADKAWDEYPTEHDHEEDLFEMHDLIKVAKQAE